MNDCAVAPILVRLERAALCLSCEAVFELTEHCPGCGSEHLASLARWLNRGAA